MTFLLLKQQLPTENFEYLWHYTSYSQILNEEFSIDSSFSVNYQFVGKFYIKCPVLSCIKSRYWSCGEVTTFEWHCIYALPSVFGVFFRSYDFLSSFLLYTTVNIVESSACDMKSLIILFQWDCSSKKLIWHCCTIYGCCLTGTLPLIL